MQGVVNTAHILKDDICEEFCHNLPYLKRYVIHWLMANAFAKSKILQIIHTKLIDFMWLRRGCDVCYLELQSWLLLQVPRSQNDRCQPSKLRNQWPLHIRLTHLFRSIWNIIKVYKGVDTLGTESFVSLGMKQFCFGWGSPAEYMNIMQMDKEVLNIGHHEIISNNYIERFQIDNPSLG